MLHLSEDSGGDLFIRALMIITMRVLGRYVYYSLALTIMV